MATVIDAFLVTLGLDPKEFEKAIKQVMSDQEKLRKESDKTADHLQEQGEKAAQFYGKMLAAAGQLFAFLAAGSSMKSFIEQEKEAEIQSARLAKQLKVNIETLGAWQNAAVISGGSAEAFNQSIKNINTNFNWLGSRRDPMIMLTQIADRMKHMSELRAMRYGQMIGLDEHTIRMLQQGSEGVQKLVDEGRTLGVTTQEQANASKELDEIQRKLSLSGTEIGRTVMHFMMPALKMLADGMMAVSNWVRQHSQVVKAAFVGIAVVIGILGLVALKAAIAMLPITLTVLAIAAAVGLLAAGVTWLYLEWKKWTSGGQSSMGEFFKFVMGVWEKIKNFVTTVFNVISQTFFDFIDAAKADFQLFWALITFDKAGVEEAWEKLTKSLGRIMKRLFNYLMYELGYLLSVMIEAWGAAWDAMKQKAKDSLNFIQEWWKNLDPTIKKVLTLNPVTGSLATGLMVQASANESVRPSTISNMDSRSRTNQVSIQEINVNAPQATDAQGVANGISGALKSEPLIAATDSGW